MGEHKLKGDAKDALLRAEARRLQKIQRNKSVAVYYRPERPMSQEREVVQPRRLPDYWR